MRAVGAVILAAGGASRFGQPKQLLRFEGETLVRRAARAAEEGGCKPIVVVAGSCAPEIAAELRDAAVMIVENREWERGLGTSIRHGLQALLENDPAVDSVVLLACDQPFVHGATVQSLLEMSEATGKPIVACSYAGTFGIPALFSRVCFELLLALPDDSGAKSLIETRRADVACVEFAEGAVDLDTPGDLERLLRRRSAD
ncbi:MAG TPA: nucleotidyltransferase family protein [Chthoniobacterales bacterium]|nr:nucleotidyltransferase family protein [Chthoniobacterales bacterium]